MGDLFVTPILIEKQPKTLCRFGHQDSASHQTHGADEALRQTETEPASLAKPQGTSTRSPWRGRLAWLVSLLGVSSLVALDGYHRTGELQRKHYADMTELKRTLELHQVESLAREKQLREDFAHRLDVVEINAKNREHMMDLAWATRLKKHYAGIQEQFDNLADWITDLEERHVQAKAQWEAEKKQSDAKLAQVIQSQSDALEDNQKGLNVLSMKLVALKSDMKKMQASIQAQQKELATLTQLYNTQAKTVDEMDRTVSNLAVAQEKSETAQKDHDLARIKHLKALTEQMTAMESRIQGLQKQVIEIQQRMPILLPPGRIIVPGRICP